MLLVTGSPVFRRTARIGFHKIHMLTYGEFSTSVTITSVAGGCEYVLIADVRVDHSRP